MPKEKRCKISETTRLLLAHEWMYSLSRVFPLAIEVAAHANIYPWVITVLDQTGTGMVEWLVDWKTINSRLQFF